MAPTICWRLLLLEAVAAGSCSPWCQAVPHGPRCRAPLLLQISDIALEDYIAVKPKSAVFVPHTAGRYQKRRFRKAQCPIVERWVDGGRWLGWALIAASLLGPAHAQPVAATDPRSGSSSSSSGGEGARPRRRALPHTITRTGVCPACCAVLAG
jgi:hypothetical protein